MSNSVGPSFAVIQTSGYMEASPERKGAAETIKSESGGDDIASSHGLAL